jgi:hypothetical protein
MLVIHRYLSASRSLSTPLPVTLSPSISSNQHYLLHLHHIPHHHHSVIHHCYDGLLTASGHHLYSFNLVSSLVVAIVLWYTYLLSADHWAHACRRSAQDIMLCPEPQTELVAARLLNCKLHDQCYNIIHVKI